MRFTPSLPALLLLAGCAMTPKTVTDKPNTASNTPGWTFQVDPAMGPEDHPAVTARTDGPAETLTFRVSTLGNAPRPLDDQTFHLMRELYYVLPVVDHDTYATLQVFSGPATPNARAKGPDRCRRAAALRAPRGARARRP